MREAAIALFRLFQNTDGETFMKVREWAKRNINTEMYMYAVRLESLYSSKTNESTLLPPFVWNPHYFISAESISKASLVACDVASNSEILGIALKRNSSTSKDLIYTINSNYSGWNLRDNEKEDPLNYFREDISLNSYNLGIHLLYPFWMPNEELKNLNPRFAEHYYYSHQQLMARYNLEKLHIKVKNPSHTYNIWDYVPYLRYKNGLPFPTRPCAPGNWSVEAYLKTLAVATNEYITKRIILMRNDEILNSTDDSNINLLAASIRTILDEVKFAKVVKSLVGYGRNDYLTNKYTPTPSILHHPETSLRDPVYWFLVQTMLDYFTDHKNTMKPFDMSQYESENFKIVNVEFSNLTTYFDYYQFPVNHALSNYVKNENDWLDFLEVRQRRLKHAKFSLNFTVESKFHKDTTVRLYLGPKCINTDCWNRYNDFFELDTFRQILNKGINNISWCPESSEKFSHDDHYNSVLHKATPATKYSIFRFPQNLIIPRGLEEGLNLTLFLMITPNDDKDNFSVPSFYKKVSNEVDSKLLGFPFHRQAKDFKHTAFNYKFYNISIYHKSQPVDFRGYFSSHLY